MSMLDAFPAANTERRGHSKQALYGCTHAMCEPLITTLHDVFTCISQHFYLGFCQVFCFAIIYRHAIHCERLFGHICMDPATSGMIKVHLPHSAFLNCAAATNDADRTLFPDIPNNQLVNMKDLERHLDLVISMYQLSPEGRTQTYKINGYSNHVSYMIMHVECDIDYGR